MSLTELQLKHAEITAAVYQIADTMGLFLQVLPTGSKRWRFRYQFNGRRNMLSFGLYPDVSIREARARRDKALAQIKDGKDPSIERQREKAVGAANTFGVIAEEYLDRLRSEGSTDKTMAKNEWLLRDLAKDLCRAPIREITAADVLTIIKRIEASGRIETAHRVRAVISAVFRLAVATLRADTDPTFALKGALTANRHRPQPAITNENKYGFLLQNIDAYDGWPTLTAAMKIMALCFPRPIELRKSRWEHFDLDRAEWLIPAEHAKMRRDFIIPLSKQAIGVVKGLKEWSSGDLVFGSIRNPERPLSENAINAALRRMGYGTDEHSAHGFRSSASTILNGRRFHPDVIEAALAHLDPNEVRRIYNRYAYWDERVEMMQQWADICDGLKRPRRNNADLI